MIVVKKEEPRDWEKLSVPLKQRRKARADVIHAIRAAKGDYHDSFFNIGAVSNGNYDLLQHQLDVLRKAGVVKLHFKPKGWKYEITPKHKYFKYLTP